MRERSNSWNAAQQKKKREARRKLREDRGYNPDAHREKDAERATGRASKKIKEVYRKYARKYEEFLMEVKNMHEGFRLEEGYPAPTLEELKQYMRWFIESTKGRLDPDGRPTMKSTLNHAENLVPGFSLETGNRIPERDAADVYNWIKKDLVQDRTIKAIERQKFDLKLCDFERAMTALWDTDDVFFMTGRSRVQFHFVTLQFLCTGARVASLTPRSEQKFERGLRYEFTNFWCF
ncbi:hypothetical protein BDV26DRAFT_300336 [Aspergillus bertholletiae]|uniref:Uncharacterized protein n=1 Tax=Aspergillus bertholletiae TaxID=1226010 RepID=A0A5N7AY17_9EURO|nr:hypothetical protein BDV26DRAFT_300336 [Aspergillus bertholletiae]